MKDKMQSKTAPALQANDVEKQTGALGSTWTSSAPPSLASAEAQVHPIPARPGRLGTLQRWFDQLDAATGLEARGIERVPEDLRHPRRMAAGSYLQIFLVFFSMNCTANQMTVGILGPVTYGLGLKDAYVCCLFGTIFGALCTGYMASFGPRTGLRTLVVARFTMGYWPSKLCVLLNLVIEIGYGLVDNLVAGLILSAVNGAGMTVVVGIVVTSLVTWVVATFGIRLFHAFEKYVWFPTVLVLFVLIGCAGPSFDITTPTAATGAALHGARVSYLFLCASGPLGWAPAAADFLSYYPPGAHRWLVTGATTLGITFGKLLIEFLGIGLGSGLASNPSWAAAFDMSTGNLIVAGFAPMGGFGRFCAVVLALCVGANNIPSVYSAALSWQLLGRGFAAVPRPVWSTLTVIISMVTAIAGRAQLLNIFLNFLAIIGYWTIVWIAVTVEEEVLFRRARGYDWARWNDRDALPRGWAALVAFGVGWAGAVVCMYETYYTGPIAAMVGDGADIGLPVAMAWSAIVYPPFRYLELKKYGR